MNLKIFLVASFAVMFSAVALFSGHAVIGAAAAISPDPIPTPGSGQTVAAFTGYKGVTIGTARADARTKLGEPKEKSDQQDYYVIADGETVQVIYDRDGSVSTISTSYFGDKVKPPAAKEVFGSDVEATPEGAINKLVKYPKSGYWISYVRTAGNDPMVLITIQKMHKDES